MVNYISWGILVVMLLTLARLIFFTVKQQSAEIITRFGKFNRIAHPGLNFRIPFVEQISGRLNLRILSLTVPVETKTQDNVFIKISISVQYQVVSDCIYEAFYRLSNPKDQIATFVFDVVRAQVPKLKLDDVFEEKDNIANAICTELSEQIQTFGYDITKTLVTDIEPDTKVKAAMNEINEQERLRVAATAKGNAEKTLKVKRAEAEAECLRLQGEGIAAQRKAIVEGLKTSVEAFSKSVPGASAQDVMQLVMGTQYYDVLKEIGASNKSTTLLLPGGIAGRQQNTILQDVLAGNVASQALSSSGTKKEAIEENG